MVQKEFCDLSHTLRKQECFSACFCHPTVRNFDVSLFNNKHLRKIISDLQNIFPSLHVDNYVSFLFQITKGTYQGTEFYERKCFQGNLQACEQKSDFVWHGDFQIEYRVCCNSSDFCNNSNIISGQFYVILLATMALFLFGNV